MVFKKPLGTVKAASRIPSAALLYIIKMYLDEITLTKLDERCDVWRMNSIMKQLTVVSTIFIPLTFLAGIWGMNFKWMPELGWRYGYVFAWTLMLILVAVIYFYFKRKKWY